MPVVLPLAFDFKAIQLIIIIVITITMTAIIIINT